jgi:hypothetical protein
VIFLVQFDRSSQRVVLLRRFPEADREQVEDIRLSLELELKRSGVEHEVVVLEAESKEALQRTHRRYFETIEELAKLPPENGR